MERDAEIGPTDADTSEWHEAEADRNRALEEKTAAFRSRDEARDELEKALSGRREAEDAAAAARDDERRTRERIAAMEAKGQLNGGAVQGQTGVQPKRPQDNRRSEENHWMEVLLTHLSGPTTIGLAVAVLGIAAGLVVVLLTWMNWRLRDRLWLAEKNDALDKQHEDLRSRIEQGRKELGEVEARRAQAAALTDRIKGLEQEWEGLGDRRRDLDSFHEEARKQVEELAWKRESEERAMEDLRREKRELEGVQAALEVKRAELASATVDTQKMQILREEITALERRKADLDGAIADAETRRKDAESAQREAERNRKAATDEFDRFAELIESKRKEVEVETEKVTELKRDATRTVEELERQRNGVKKASQEIDDLRARKAALGERIRELEKRRAQPDEGGLAELHETPHCLIAAKAGGWTKPRPAKTELESLAAVEESLQRAGLTFGQRTIYAFHTALKVADISPMTVLAGISGTGKSQLPRRYAEAMGIHFLQVPVQPRWDSPQDLMGFYNFVDARYRATELARLLAHLDSENWPDLAKEWEGRMALVLLDEMNLARTEYYFSEFLSRLEMRPERGEEKNPGCRSDAEIELDVPGESGAGRRVYAGYRVLFAGTMNEDESTQTLSDKVLDRSNVLRFTRPEKLEFRSDGEHGSNGEGGYLTSRQWEQWIGEPYHRGDREGIENAIDTLNWILGRAQRGFGHRMAQAIGRYVQRYPEPENWRSAIADQVEMRVLPKLRGVDPTDPATEQALKELGEYATGDLEDPTLGEAIQRDAEAGAERGLFAWTGLDRPGHLR